MPLSARPQRRLGVAARHIHVAAGAQQPQPHDTLPLMPDFLPGEHTVAGHPTKLPLLKSAQMTNEQATAAALATPNRFPLAHTPDLAMLEAFDKYGFCGASPAIT